MSENVQANTLVPAPRILVVDDDANYGKLVCYQLRRNGYEPLLAPSGEEALSRLDEFEPALMLLDVRLPGRSGPQLLEEFRARRPEMPVVMMTAAGSIELAVECIKRGAYHFLVKPLDPEQFQLLLRNALAYHQLQMRVAALEGALAERHAFSQVVAHNAAMKRVVDQARRASQINSDILILGQSGTGKEVLARAIHFNSLRRRGPFVAINCGAIPEGLLESELFGHEKGAFTGAVMRRRGCFEEAHGGTLFLDEIAEMRPEMQVRLLRALEQREVRRVGSDRTIQVDVRVISATNQDLRARLRAGRFRADLYYRLAIVVLELPPLRERPEDIGPLAMRFLEEARREGHTRAATLAPATMDILARYPWPGNVRELRNAIEHALAFEDSEVVRPHNLPRDVREWRPAVPMDKTEARLEDLPTRTDSATFTSPAAPPSTLASPSITPAPLPPLARLPEFAPPAEAPPTPPPAESPPADVPPTDGATGEQEGILSMDEEEQKIILKALALTGGNVSEAARRLGLHRSTLHRKMTRFGLATPDEATSNA
jgi:two-component system response regulator AtoC